jgi:A/G-specific adenine glycosylase
MDVVLSTIDQEHPREFYWALMDYGSWLKRQGVGGIRQSSHYKKQSVLKGSLREVRGMIVKQLVAGPQTKKDLRQAMPKDDRFLVALADLERENLITVQNDTVWLTK